MFIEHQNLMKLRKAITSMDLANIHLFYLIIIHLEELFFYYIIILFKDSCKSAFECLDRKGSLIIIEDLSSSKNILH